MVYNRISSGLTQLWVKVTDISDFTSPLHPPTKLSKFLRFPSSPKSWDIPRHVDPGTCDTILPKCIRHRPLKKWNPQCHSKLCLFQNEGVSTPPSQWVLTGSQPCPCGLLLLTCNLFEKTPQLSYVLTCLTSSLNRARYA